MAEEELRGGALEEMQDSVQQKAVINALQQYKDLLRAGEVQSTQDDYVKQVQAVLERIFYLIEPNLRNRAKRYFSSDRVREEIRNSVSSASDDLFQILACDMFAYLLPSLRKVEPNPDKNIVALLVHIADINWRKDFRYYSRSFLVEFESQANNPALVDETPIASIDDRLHYRTLCDLVNEFVGELSPVDRWIFEARLALSPVPYMELAQRLGPGHTEAMLRKRFSRMLRKLQVYLEQNYALEVGG